MRTFLPRPSARAPEVPPLAAVTVTPAERRRTHLAASVLLEYPDARVRDAVPDVAAVVATLPEPVATRLARFLRVLEERPSAELEAAYVATFDLKRRCSMYLTYYATGDTRKRGTALVRFAEAYRAAGWERGGDELPDYLPMVLEFSARAHDDDAARIAAGLLGAHRDGIEVLRSALTAAQSPWTDVVEAVCLTLGPLDDATRERFVELVTAGPPTEMVGLSALGPYETGPAAQSSATTGVRA
ncbi:nitrate reductase molybdenum cofactor assembly chaperone [Beutenbergia cavernae DSM 12333]|uniref:Nitrate reductase molybdenum cofactor assembly chaperone n=1 Tax=Beutenbergia cavernae (strain ATCC BAA-8 / DSM 12333 / CCUG 43141 / JCM 11478 / NBRC 16432 / NCIMB 13614 / HKI 0122) TaxID=471853 RepID=C5BYF0_BEUC1|nr:nitrate reductase molybdenum cofactor assembly chaperone [Beutenbergia cavernae]ACQ81050.1 nitrate reductase molybdenum cofactor assembly chaperone [Beutenbergia cavernae DSM 12333]